MTGKKTLRAAIVGLRHGHMGSIGPEKPGYIQTFKGLPDDDIAAMLGGNAAECYALDTEKLAPLAAQIGPEKQLFQAA